MLTLIEVFIILQDLQADCVRVQLEGEGERCSRDGVTEDRRQVSGKRQEDRQAELRLKLWVVADGEDEEERGGGSG